MPHRARSIEDLYRLGERIGLTLNEKYDVGSPHTSRDSYNNPILVPNGDSGGVYKFHKGCRRRKRTFEVQSTAKMRRGPGKLRPREKGGKRD